MQRVCCSLPSPTYVVGVEAALTCVDPDANCAGPDREVGNCGRRLVSDALSHSRSGLLLFVAQPVRSSCTPKTSVEYPLRSLSAFSPMSLYSYVQVCTTSTAASFSTRP